MILDKFALTDRIAIVTGAGRGIGKGIAKAMAEAGAHVAVTSRTADQIKATAADARALGRKALAIPCDVRKGEQVADMVKQVLDAFGRIDILVNNVGGQFFAPFRKISEGGWDAIINLNLKSVYFCCKAVYETMYRQEKGNIINISSFVSKYPSKGSAHYGAAKAGIDNLTKVLAVEWARYNIRVNAILPGIILTSASENIFSDTARREEAIKKTPLGRLGLPEDVAGAAVFLASDASSFITGEAIVIDGGPLVMDR